MKGKHYAAAAILACICGSSAVNAQAIPNRLSGIKSLKCEFSASAVGKWQKGEAVSQAKSGGLLSFSIDRIDTDDGSARFIGIAAPPADILAQLRGWVVHFVDARPDGGLNVTTVFSQESRDRKLKAVYMRTSYLPIDLPGFQAEPEVAQYYGECEAGR